MDYVYSLVTGGWGHVGDSYKKKLCCLSVDDRSWALPVRISSGPYLKSVETITGKSLPAVRTVIYDLAFDR